VSGENKRAGLPLSAKLIAATSILLALAVGAASWLGHRTVDRVAGDDAAAWRASGERGIERESSLLARNAASTAALPLGGESVGDVAQAMKAIASEYKRVLWILVADRRSDPPGLVISATADAPAIKVLDDELSTQLATGAPGSVVSRRDAPGEPTWTYATRIQMGETVLGELRMGVTTADLEAELGASLADARGRASDSMRWILLTAAGILLAGVLIAAFQALRIVRPLRALAQQAGRIAGGDLATRVPVTSRDEIGVLADNFNFMADQLVHLLRETAAKASLEREMSLARSMQQAMIPPPDPVAHGVFKLIGHCMPASSCGGDWWMYRGLSGGRVLLIVGDATGHGIHSAIVASTARGTVEALADIDERLLEPEQVLRAIDSAIRNLGDHSMVMTAFAALLDPVAGVIHYANAGHNFPYVVHMKPGRRLAETSVLAKSGNPLGDPACRPLIQKGDVRLRPGDLLVLFTDGVVERSNPAGKLFGDRRLRSALVDQTLDREAGSLVTLRDFVLGAVERFAEGSVPDDDVTFVMCIYDPPAEILEAAS
jgi:sigma-B regulation protein RsbU (phosphoserine phosphatase)